MIRLFKAFDVAPIFLLLIGLMLVGGNLVAQSVTLPLTDSGALVRGEGAISLDGEFGISFCAGYSISGVLDLGVQLGADVIPATSSITSDIGMFYDFAPLKQTQGMPFSGQVSGSYTFRTESSDYLTRNRLVRESRGYTLGLALVRDTFLGGAFGIRTAALAEYANYLATTTVGFDPTGVTGTSEVDYAEYPRTERVSAYGYGGYLGIIVRGGRGRAVLLGSSVLLDPSRAFEIRPDIQMHVSR